MISISGLPEEEELEEDAAGEGRVAMRTVGSSDLDEPEPEPAPAPFPLPFPFALALADVVLEILSAAV